MGSGTGGATRRKKGLSLDRQAGGNDPEPAGSGSIGLVGDAGGMEQRKEQD
jgi:hypothetical protein